MGTPYMSETFHHTTTYKGNSEPPGKNGLSNLKGRCVKVILIEN